MTEYWVSQSRKFCNFCKCWLTDNKPSIEFHERGKRHQENVKKKISELKKKGLSDAKNQEELQGTMARVEAAALAAFKKDLTADPELAKSYGFKPVVEGPSLPPAATSTTTHAAGSDGDSNKGKDVSVDWYEAAASNGVSYYWNIKTKETTWTKPNNYVTIAGQEKLKKKKTDKSPSRVKVAKSESTEEKSSNIIHAAKPKLVMHQTASSYNTSSISSADNVIDKSELNQSAIGAWIPVEEKTSKEEPVDLQLPVKNEAYITLPIYTEDKPKMKKFTEKIVTSLADGENDHEVTFKKRKINKTQKPRQRLDED